MNNSFRNIFRLKNNMTKKNLKKFPRPIEMKMEMMRVKLMNMPISCLRKK